MRTTKAKSEAERKLVKAQKQREYRQRSRVKGPISTAQETLDAQIRFRKEGAVLDAKQMGKAPKVTSDLPPGRAKVEPPKTSQRLSLREQVRDLKALLSAHTSIAREEAERRRLELMAKTEEAEGYLRELDVKAEEARLSWIRNRDLGEKLDALNVTIRRLEAEMTPEQVEAAKFCGTPLAIYAVEYFSMLKQDGRVLGTFSAKDYVRKQL